MAGEGGPAGLPDGLQLDAALEAPVGLVGLPGALRESQSSDSTGGQLDTLSGAYVTRLCAAKGEMSPGRPWTWSGAIAPATHLRTPQAREGAPACGTAEAVGPPPAGHGLRASPPLAPNCRNS